MRTFLVLILSTIVPGCGVLSRIALPQDLSEFEEFSFTTTGVFGICPEEDSVAEAHITQSADESFTIQLGIAFFNEHGEAEIVPEPERVLSTDEVDRMDEAFRRVFIHPLLNGACLILPFDPCRVEHYRWDSFEAGGYFCSLPRVGDRSVASIREFLESLRME